MERSAASCRLIRKNWCACFDDFHSCVCTFAAGRIPDMIENQNARVTQKKKKYGRLKDFICFSVAAFISFSQVSPIWAAEGTRVFDEAGLFSAEEVQELETRIDEVRGFTGCRSGGTDSRGRTGESAESYADDFTTATDWASGTMRVVFCFRSIWTTGRYMFLPPGMR